MKNIVLLILAHFFCHQGWSQDTISINEDLFLIPITANSYIHVSMLSTEDYGKVACNGLLYVVGKEAIMADTPASLEATKALLDWLDQQDLNLKGVLVNHFHEDCLAGLSAIHERGINSFGHIKTPGLALQDQLTPPRLTFSDSLVLTLGNQQVIAAYLGPGHSPDNAVVFIPQDGLLFGGCLVKSDGASKGYLGAADINKWSQTVASVKNRFSPQWVIPGHGKHGGTELLDYTIKLFEVKIE